MSDAFYTMLGIVLPILIVQGVQVWQSSRNNKKSSADREELKAQVCEVREHISTIATTKADVAQQIAGAERQNVAKGIEIGKQQATGPAELSGK